jgi:hypothetical protein
MFRKLSFGLAALIASFLAGCSTVESRIESNPQIYASFSPEDQALVRQGRIREGMPKAAVFLAWGNPDRIRSGVRLGHSFEAWVYTTTRSTVLPDYYYYPGFTHSDTFAAEFGTITTISILLVSIRIPSTRIRT